MTPAERAAAWETLRHALMYAERPSNFYEDGFAFGSFHHARLALDAYEALRADDESEMLSWMTAVNKAQQERLDGKAVDQVELRELLEAERESHVTLGKTPEDLARRFHEVYERLAPSFGYETRTETRQFDPTTPNGRLMVAVCGELMEPKEEA